MLKRQLAFLDAVCRRILNSHLTALFPARARLAFQTSVLLIGLATLSDALAQIQIVNCDAPVQSRKRGIGGDMSGADFEAVAPGVSWYYRWDATPLTLPDDVTMDFIPMAWNGDPGGLTSISNYLAAGNRPWRVFALNEPNLKGQAFMTPSNSAVTFEQVKALCDPYNIPIICPHMAEGSATNNSITAYDPIQMTNVTYTSPIPFLYAFLYYCGATVPAGVSTHSYGGYGDLHHWTGEFHNDWPTQTVWVTEFNASGATSDAQVLATLIPAVDYCESTSWIEGYSWFMSRISGDPYNSLLSTNSGVLTAAGQAYVQMPVHQTNLYYRIPGRLQAERYVTMNQMSIAPTTDVDGLADMKSTAAGGSLDYNIQVDAAGTYPLNVRVSHAGLIQFYENGTLLGTATNTQSGWATVLTTVALPAGTQTLHVVLSANAQLLNWINFLATNGIPSVPDNLAATAGNGQVALTWSLSAGATGYWVKRSTTNGGPYTFIASPTATGYTNTGLADGVTYYYVVSATNAAGESSNSIQVSATTPTPQSSGTAAFINIAGDATNLVSSPNNGNYWNNIGSGSSGKSQVFSQATGLINLTNWAGAYGTSIPLTNTVGTASGWSLSISNLVGGGATMIQGDFHDFGSGSLTYSSNLTAIWPTSALADGLEFKSNQNTNNPSGSPTLSIILSGLTANDTYTVLLYSGEPGYGTANVAETNILVSSAVPITNIISSVENNISTVCGWTNINPNSSGQIILTMTVGSGNGTINCLLVSNTTATTTPGGITTGGMSENSLTLNWTANANVALQSTTNLTPPAVWTDVPGTTGQGSATITTTNIQMFFRLIQP